MHQWENLIHLKFFFNALLYLRVVQENLEHFQKKNLITVTKKLKIDAQEMLN